MEPYSVGSNPFGVPDASPRSDSAQGVVGLAVVLSAGEKLLDETFF
jgi:hypothetical protein